MPSTKRAVLMIALLMVITTQANALAPKDYPKTVNYILPLLLIVEVDHWGKKDGIKNLSYIGTWKSPLGYIEKISKVGDKILFRMEFGHNYYDDTWINIGKDSMWIKSGQVFRRSMQAPSYQTSGKFLSTWMYKETDGNYYPLFVFTQDVSVVLTYCQDPKDMNVSYRKYWRDGKCIMTKGEKGPSEVSYIAVQPKTQPEPEAWKCLPQGSYNNLSFMVLCTQCYTDDHNGKLPSMQTSKQIRDALYPYMEDDVIFKQPGSHIPFKLNAALSGKKASTIKNPSTTVLYYDPKPWPDGSRCVAFVSRLFSNKDRSSVRIVSKEEWAKIAKANHIM